jgi:hypothetical protein
MSRQVRSRNKASQPGTVFGGGDVQAQDLAVPVSVDAGGEQGVHVHDPAALADLQHQRVRGDEHIRGGAGGRVRKSSTVASSSAAITDTCDLLSRVMPTVWASFSIHRVDTPSR